MYRGTVTKLSWERVYLTIEGDLAEVPAELQSDSLRHRFQDIYYQKLKDRKREVTDDEILKRFTSHAETLRNLSHADAGDREMPCLFLRTADYLQVFPLDAGIREDGHFSAVLNVTTFSGRKEIPAGVYYISVLHDDIDFELNIAIDVAEKTFEYSRPFVFNKRRSCYIVNFSFSDDEQDPLFILQSMLFTKEIKKKFDRTLFVRKAKDVVFRGLMKAYYSVLYHLAPHKGNKILFATESRGDLQGNLKAVYDRMIERGLDKDYKIYRSFRKSAGGHSGIGSWVKIISYLALSDKVLMDDYAPLFNWLKLKSGTELIQLWHAGVGFKSVGLARFGITGSPLLDNPHRQYDYAICGSTSLKHIYSEVFGIEEDAIVPTGLPRIDVLFDEKRNDRLRDEFRDSHPEFGNRKVILFAPTFRGTGAINAGYPFEMLDMQKIYDMCGDDYVFCFRMHPFIKKKVTIPDEYSDRLYDLSGQGDTNDLLPCVDIMITDYSSIIYEFSLFRKPIIFFAFDRREYSAVRGFQSDFEETAPGKICDTIDEIRDTIDREDFRLEKLDRFVKDNYDYLDAGSTDRVIDKLILKK